MFIYSWNFFSHSARHLSEALKAKRITHEKSRFKGSPKKVVINWGSSELPPEVGKCKVLNPPKIVKTMTDKLSFFKSMDQTCRLPPFTDDPNQAKQWLKEGYDVCARTILNSHSARGLVLLHPNDRFVSAPLYTRYVPKLHEYRVHCVGDEVVDVQRKAARSEFDGEVNWQIRNLDNGFIYAREGVKPAKDVLFQASKCFLKSGLDFGAVDVIYNQEGRHAYVLEINTAPGLEGQTIENYAQAINAIIRR